MSTEAMRAHTNNHNDTPQVVLFIFSEIYFSYARVKSNCSVAPILTLLLAILDQFNQHGLDVEKSIKNRCACHL